MVNVMLEISDGFSSVRVLMYRHSTPTPPPAFLQVTLNICSKYSNSNFAGVKKSGVHVVQCHPLSIQTNRMSGKKLHELDKS